MNWTPKQLGGTGLLIAAFFSGTAHADLTAWVNAVAAGAPASFTSTNVALPAVVDIGVISNAQGTTYEFVVNATNAGLSSALMGARNTGFGTNSAFKFEQYADTTSFGITSSGVADWTIAPNVEQQDVHVAFVVDTSNAFTQLFVDGVSMGTAPHAAHFTNTVGLGEWYDPNGSVDLLTGSMHGVAVYESMLSAAELLEHANAFHSTEPGTRFCFGSSCPCANNDALAGCANSAGVGAELISSGSTNISSDDLALHAAGLAPGQPALMFSADNALAGGNGMIFGDGLRCAGGNAVRFAVKTANALGEADWGPGLSPGGGWSSGQTKCFQVWYADPLGAPCGGGFNLSNGVEVSFTP